MDNSKEDIKDISKNMADATKESIETTARAVKKGIIEEESIYCKHCGIKQIKILDFVKDVEKNNNDFFNLMKFYIK